MVDFGFRVVVHLTVVEEEANVGRELVLIFVDEVCEVVSDFTEAERGVVLVRNYIRRYANQF